MISAAIMSVRLLVRSFGREGGAGLVEYAVIIALIAIGAVAALAFVAGGIGNVYEMVTDNLEAVVTNEDPVEVGRRRGRGWCKRFGC